MSLAEVKRLLQVKDSPGVSCEDANLLSEEPIAHVTARMVELRKLRGELLGLRQRCKEERSGSECGIVKSLSNKALCAAKPSDSTHNRAHARSY